MRIYLDLDGVMANFSKGACRMLELPYPTETEFFTDYWIEKYINWNEVRHFFNSEWFWANLEPFPWAKRLDALCSQYDPNYNILTKSLPYKSCFSGKYDWIKRHFAHKDENLIIVRGDKSRCCGDYTDVLIDDNVGNIGKWLGAGGSVFHWRECTDDISEELIENKMFHLKEALDNVSMAEKLCVN